jgi:hypothetical protein
MQMNTWIATAVVAAFVLMCPRPLSAFIEQDSAHPFSEETSIELFGLQIGSKFTGKTESLQYIDLTYGTSTVNRQGFAEVADAMPSYRIRFGTDNRRYYDGTGVMRSNRSGVSLDFLNADPFQGDNALGPKTRVTMWSLSLDNSTGFGYELGGDTRLVLSHGGGGMWGWLDRQSMAVTDTQHVVDFGRAMRFGERSTAGVQLQLSSAFSIDVNADWSLLYPRHMFLQWATSHIIEGVADGVVAALVTRVGLKSPAALPILHFLLRNGVAAGFKLLRTRDMTWPFDSAPALSVITYRVGFGMAF